MQMTDIVGMKYHRLSLTSISVSEVVIVADEFMPPCQRVLAMTVKVYMAAGIRTGVVCSQPSRLKTTRPQRIVV